MTTHNRDSGLAGVTLSTSGILHESLGTDDVEGGDTEQLLGIELASLLQHLGGDRDGAVDGVGDDQDVCVGSIFGDALNKTLDDAGVDLEEVVTGHARLAYSIILS